jgi:hypothetical protein
MLLIRTLVAMDGCNLQIENTSYSKNSANIYHRLFNETNELDCAAKNAIKFNDLFCLIIVCKDFVVLNSTWNLDNINQLQLVEHYKDATATRQVMIISRQ